MKKRITIRIDEDIVEWFKSLDGNYQTLMNDALDEYMFRGKILMEPESVNHTQRGSNINATEVVSRQIEAKGASVAVNINSIKKVIKTVEDVPNDWPGVSISPYTKERQTGRKKKGKK